MLAWAVSSCLLAFLGLVRLDIPTRSRDDYQERSRLPQSGLMNAPNVIYSEQHKSIERQESNGWYPHRDIQASFLCQRLSTSKSLRKSSIGVGGILATAKFSSICFVCFIPTSVVVNPGVERAN